MKFIIYCLIILAVLIPETGAAPVSGEIKVINAGIGGNNTRDALQRLDKDVIRNKPEMVIIGFGANDALNSGKLVPLEEYKSNIDKLTERLSKGGVKEVVLLTPPPIIETYLKKRHLKHPQKENLEKHLEQYIEILKKTAEDKNVTFIDFYAIINEHGGATEKPECLIRNVANSKSADGIHPAPKGYELLAENIYAAVKDKVKPGFKIVCFGDSITYGSHVDGEGTSGGQTYPAVLSRLLNGKSSYENFNLLNYPSFDSNIYWKHSGEGTLKKLKNGGIDNSKCGELTGGYIIQRISRAAQYPPYIGEPAGRLCKFSVMAKGSGTLELIITSYRIMEDGKFDSGPLASKKVHLSDKWQEIEITARENNPRSASFFLILKVGPESKVLLDNAAFYYIQEPGLTLTISPSAICASPGDGFNIRIILKKNDKPCPEAQLDIHEFQKLTGFDCVMKSSTVKTDKDGKATFKVKVPPDISSDGMRLTISSSDHGSGTVKNLYIPVFKKEKTEIINSIASNVKISKPLRIIYIGDSLSDMFRGYNYTDMTDYYLNKFNPGMVSFWNAGVGGDYITRVWERIEGIDGNKPGYRQYMYDDFLSSRPGLIFIFLGHNDTKASSQSNYKIPLVTPEKQYETYKKLIKYLREKAPAARIVFISASSSYLPEIKKGVQKRIKEGLPHTHFGLDEHIVNFNNVLKKLSKEENIDYIDFYTPTRDYPEKASLFLPNDGVHMTNTGNLLLTEKIIEYISKKYPQKD